MENSNKAGDNGPLNSNESSLPVEAAVPATSDEIKPTLPAKL